MKKNMMVIMIVKSLITDAESSVLIVKATVRRSMVTLVITIPTLIVIKRIVFSHRLLEALRYRLCMRANNEHIKLERHVSPKIAKPHVQGRAERIITSKNARAQKSVMQRQILRLNMQLRSFNPTQPKYSTNGSVKAIGTH
jgi:hypothetical protein